MQNKDTLVFTIDEIEQIGQLLGDLEIKAKESEKILKILQIFRVKFQEQHAKNDSKE